MAEAALMQLKAVYGGIAPAMVKDGAKMFQEVADYFMSLAGLVGDNADDPKENRRKLAAQLIKMGAASK